MLIKKTIYLLSVGFMAFSLADCGVPQHRATHFYTMHTYAGNGTYGFSGDGGAATSAQMTSPRGVAFDSAGNLYIADTWNHCVRRVIKTTGIISTVVGQCGNQGFSGDGKAATLAKLNKPYDVAVNSYNDLFIADASNHRIRMVDHATGIISTIAGDGTGAFSGDGGPAVKSQIQCPYGVMIFKDDIIITDSLNNRIRRINHKNNIISTIAGDGRAAFGGDGGPATAAQIFNPYDTCADAKGNIYIGDYLNNAIRRINAVTGIITTVAGIGGSVGYSGDGGPATAALLKYPHGIDLDSNSNLYIADRDNYRVRKVDLKTGIITTFTGTGTPGYSGDKGPAEKAAIQRFRSVAVDSESNVFIVDSDNYRIRVATFDTPSK